ncbi:MAG TPA: AraC family transcriptional regulator [Candidatus Fusicatenibacter intestinigallinarum]|uniref:AraC family transcriptional regulator n=1 Tax=Candidatus Fusicatenibacter intestinigallinarum TaxID=2838598 RepID=A0A9D2SMV4_9FIRM|nr:AraC family transcriptional regulator [Candidatus Fusicatenibacter intestinigallinarum]
MNCSYFNRSFRKAFGVSPREYRKRIMPDDSSDQAKNKGENKQN